MNTTIGISAYICISAAAGVGLSIDNPKIAITSRLSSRIAGSVVDG